MGVGVQEISRHTRRYRSKTAKLPGALPRPRRRCLEPVDMTQNDLKEKERIARKVTGQAFSELSPIQQNVIESCAGAAEIKDPFAMLRRDADE